MNAPLAVASLAWRELIRFYRQKARVIGALGPPLIFWFFIGSGLGPTGGAGGVAYLEYFFPGTVALVVLFTAIFATISLVEDRHEGFLQGVLVAPVSRGAFVAGKLLGATALAILQGALFLLLAPAAGIHPAAAPLGLALLSLTVLSFGLTGLGFLLAWRLDSSQGFHAVMNLFLIPMWMLSGALFPGATAKGWVKLVMAVNPMTYGVAAMRHGLYPAGSPALAGLPDPATCLAASGAFAVVLFALSAWSARR